MNSIYNRKPYFITIIFNFVLQPTPISPQWLNPSLYVSDWNAVWIPYLSHVCYIPCLSHHSHDALTTWVEKYKFMTFLQPRWNTYAAGGESFFSPALSKIWKTASCRLSAAACPRSAGLVCSLMTRHAVMTIITVVSLVENVLIK